MLRKENDKMKKILVILFTIFCSYLLAGWIFIGNTTIISFAFNLSFLVSSIFAIASFIILGLIWYLLFKFYFK